MDTEQNQQAPQQYQEESRLFVGNLSWGTTDVGLMDAFKDFGVTEAKVIMDRTTGRSRGFGFVSFKSQDDADRAKSAMHDYELDGRNIRVDTATSQPQRR